MESFSAVADALSFGEAARRIGASQSAVSQAVNRLEERLGSRLVERTTRRVSLTADGAALKAYAAAMIRIADETRRHFASGGRKTIRIGMVEDFAMAGLHRMLGLLMEEEPGIAMIFRTGLSTHLRRLMSIGDLDVALTKRLPGTATGRLIGSRPLIWVGDYRLSGHVEAVPVITYPAPSETRTMVTDALRSAGRNALIVAESDGITGLQCALQAGLGVAAFAEGLLPAGVSQRVVNDLPALANMEYVLETRPAPHDLLLEAFVTVTEALSTTTFPKPLLGE